MISKSLSDNIFMEKPKASYPAVQKISCVVNKRLTENRSQGKGIVYCQNGRMLCLEPHLGPVLFSSFSNDPDNMQKLSITFVGDINLEETHVV